MGTLLNGVIRNSEGRTLVRVLIVIAIVGALAGIIVPNIRGLIGAGKPEAAKAESLTIQNAMTTMMTDKQLTTVTANTTATNDMTAFPDSGHALFPTYFFISKSQGTYTCDEKGKITQVTTGY